MDFIFEPSLLLYLPLYQLDGASFMSKGTHGRLCTATGALWTPSGRYFDGSDDYIDCGKSTPLQAARGTLMAWVTPKFADFPQSLGVICGLPYDDGAWNDPYFGFSIGIIKTDGRIRWYGAIGGTYQLLDSDSGEIVSDKFYHIVASWDGTVARLYKNGLEVKNSGETLPSGDITYGSPDPSFVVGVRSKGAKAEYFAGNVALVGFYNRALNPMEIQHNYLATKWRYR